MSKVLDFKGKIFFNEPFCKEKKTLFCYDEDIMPLEFEESLMTAFGEFAFSAHEKAKLSVDYRHRINQFKSLNVFNLKAQANALIEKLEKVKFAKVELHAQGYGCYIALAALYSGNMPKNLKIDFHFKNSPLALFPKTMVKHVEFHSHHQVHYQIDKTSWLAPFETLTKADCLKMKVYKAS